ncbi:MAG TPA: putative F420-0 ABC transporter substrate-binding protein [Microlunatus sp.]|nr:putative F420-0 ABC transporter substrate-binding protein [Microlunatus sp.]
MRARTVVPSPLSSPSLLSSPSPLLVLTLVTVLLAGCAAPAPAAAPPSASYRPVTLDNCGTEVTVERPPERVVAIKSTAIEMLLALGLGDRIVGTAFADGPLPEAYAGTELPVLAEKVPGREALLAARPDFVYAGWESNLTAQGAGDRAALAELGVPSYVAPAACKDPEYQPKPLTREVLEREMREIAEIFGVPERAEKLITEQRAELAGVRKDPRQRTVLWYSSGKDTPYVGAGIGAPQLIMESVGLRNIFADVPDTWSSVSWESVLDADPDLIVLVDATWNTAESKRKFLASSPAAALDAVREQRYLTVRFPAGEGGVATAEAVASLARQVEQLP